MRPSATSTVDLTNNRSVGRRRHDEPDVERMILVTALDHCARTVATGADAEFARGHDEAVVQVCRDTASLCRLCAELVARDSPFVEWIMLSTMLASEACAEECDAVGDDRFDRCADACRVLRRVVDGLDQDVAIGNC